MLVQILFYIFGTLLVASALGLIVARNPVFSALFLVLCFCNSAVIWLLTGAEFLAIVLVLVYVGAVMVLFLFVVMMLDINLDRLREGFWRNLPLAGAVGVLMVVEMAALFLRAATGTGAPGAPPADYSNSKALGAVIYTDYVFPFELAAVVLLVAIVAAIALTLRHRKETKYQDPATQLSVRAKDRLKIVKLPPETQVPVEPPPEAAK